MKTIRTIIKQYYPLEQEFFIFARFLKGIALACVLTADWIWIFQPRDHDIISIINPWVTLTLAVGVTIWAIVPPAYVYIVDEVLWLTFGWWIILFARLALHPQPHQVTGYDRYSWLWVYFGMAILSIGLWFGSRRAHR